MPEHACKQELTIEKLIKWKDGDNSQDNLGAEKRIFKMERDFYDNGEKGAMSKMAEMYEWFKDQVNKQGRRKVSIGRIFELSMALLNSGLLLFILSKL